MEIEKILKELKVNNYYRGYYYLVAALRLLLKKGILHYNMKQLYTEIKETYTLTSEHAVERAIRYAVSNSRLPGHSNKSFLFFAYELFRERYPNYDNDSFR